MRASRRMGCAGLTILECLVALGIVAVAMAAAAPSVSSAMQGVRLRGAAVQVAAALVRGRAGALAEGRSWELRLAGEDAFDLGPVAGAKRRERLASGAAFDGATSGASVRFSASGVAENATIRVRLGDLQRRIVVNQRGRVTLE